MDDGRAVGLLKMMLKVKLNDLFGRRGNSSDRLLQKFDKQKSLFNVCDVGVVAFPCPKHMTLMDSLRDLQIRPHWFTSLEELKQYKSLFAFDALIVCSESFNSIEQMVDELIYFRNNSFDLPLVLLSSFSHRDDLSSSRSAICDATLASPVGTERMRTGLIAALVNSKQTGCRPNIRCGVG